MDSHAQHITELKSKLKQRSKAMKPSAFKIFSESLFITVLIAIDLWLLYYIYRSLQSSPVPEMLFAPKLEDLQGLNTTLVEESSFSLDRAQLKDFNNSLIFAEKEGLLPPEIVGLFLKNNIPINDVASIYSEAVDPVKYAKLNRLTMLYFILRKNLHRDLLQKGQARIHQSNIDKLGENQTRLDTERKDNADKISQIEKMLVELKSQEDTLDSELAKLKGQQETHLQALRTNTDSPLELKCSSVSKERDILEDGLQALTQESTKTERDMELAAEGQHKESYASSKTIFDALQNNIKETKFLLEEAEERLATCKEQPIGKMKDLPSDELALLTKDQTLKEVNGQIELILTKKATLQEEVEFYQSAMLGMQAANNQMDEESVQNYRQIEAERESLQRFHANETQIAEIQRSKKNYLDYLDELIRD